MFCLTSQQVKNSNAQSGREASTETSTEPGQACQHHHTKRHQWQQKLAPPQICTYKHRKVQVTKKKGLSSVITLWCLQRRHCLKSNSEQTRGWMWLTFSHSFRQFMRVNKMIYLCLNLQVRTMSSPLLWFPGSLYLGVNCWDRVKLRHSSTILASERGQSPLFKHLIPHTPFSRSDNVVMCWEMLSVLNFISQMNTQGRRPPCKEHHENEYSLVNYKSNRRTHLTQQEVKQQKYFCCLGVMSPVVPLCRWHFHYFYPSRVEILA